MLRVWIEGLGLSAQGCGFRVECQRVGLGFSSEGPGFSAHNLGLSVQRVGLRLSSQGLVHRIQD